MNPSPHILVVDDDPDLLKILKDQLIMDGYRVHTAHNGRQALKRFNSEPCDLIILDWMLPDLDGLQVCRKLRTKSNVPIIMLTAKDSVSDKVLGLEYGADDYLVKPFDYLELAARIKVRLRRRAPAVTTRRVHDAGTIRLDPNDRSVERNGGKVQLTKKEFDLLHLLIDHADQVLAREQILKALWPKAKLYKWSRTIDVHIQHLRAKLQDNSSTPQIIRTVPGVGYMFKYPEDSKD